MDRRRMTGKTHPMDMKQWLTEKLGAEYANLPAHIHRNKVPGERDLALSESGYRGNCYRCRWLKNTGGEHQEKAREPGQRTRSIYAAYTKPQPAAGQGG